MVADAREVIAGVLASHGVSDPAGLAAVLHVELAAKCALGDANYLRWCQWPDCLRSYHVLTGPDPQRDGRGWIYVRNGDSVLLCPDHANAGHRPRRSQWQPGWNHIDAECECGARGEGLEPTSLERAQRWWCGHVLDALARAHEQGGTD